VGAPSSYDAVTGYREPVRRALRAIPDGAVVGGWQSGALGYYGTGRTVVNLDGAVNPEAAGATGTELARYLRERRIEWLADFALVVVRLRFDLAALRPPPTSRIVATVPAAGATPEYSVARLSWP
jgi:hypothetical protein